MLFQPTLWGRCRGALMSIKRMHLTDPVCHGPGEGADRQDVYFSKAQLI